MAYRARLLHFILLVVLVSASPARGETGEALFQKQCAGCHSVGGGDGVGPDLKGVATRRDKGWLIRIIVEPDRLTAERDPTQLGLMKKFNMQMPRLGVSREDAAAIVSFLSAAAPPAPGAAAPAQKKEAAAVTPELVAQGKALFTGERPFAKGGAPCGACHRLRYPGIAGGTLGADLTGLYQRIGESGVSGVLSSLQFPVMKAVFAERPLTDRERAALLVLWKDAARRQEGGGGAPFPAAGFGVFALSLLGFAIYDGRAR